jgi:hypothetical protein
MNVADMRAELEDELEWRLEEIRFLKNQLSDIRTRDQRDRHRRALVVMLYSHFEGFWRAAFSIYVKAINAESILCRDATYNLVAASLFEVLSSLSDHNKKHPFFRSRTPEDVKLHQLHRQVEFLSRLPDLDSSKIAIPAEKVIDPEANLKPDVIRKNLFRLGFPYDLFQPYEGTVHHLLNKRNAVAHGSTRLGIEEDDYNKLESAVLDVMNDVIRLLFESLRQKAYLRNPEPDYCI